MYIRKRRKKKNLGKFFILFIIFVLFVFLTIYFSIKLILSATSAIVSLKKEDNKTITRQEKPLILPALEIENFPTATNSAYFEIKGKVKNIDTLSFFINKVKVKEIYPEDSEFSVTIGPLEDGENEVLVKGENDEVNKTESKELKVIFNSKAPKIILGPIPENVNQEEIEITGRIENNVDTVKVNNLPVTLSAEKSFKATVRLKEGENTIRITAEDDAGNVTAKEVKITYSPAN